MSEPVNPLFEEEKAFLERKKQEYERALRGDVAMLKEQAGHAGRIAAVGAGLAGSIWLITKAFSSSSKKRPRQQEYEGYGYGPDDYPTQHFGDYDPYDEESDHRASRWYASDDEPDEDTHGTVYHSGTDQYDSPSAQTDQNEPATSAASLAEDDQPAPLYFPHHAESAASPDTDPGQATEHFESEAYGHPESTLPFDDSRRLPESADFQEPEKTGEDFERRIPTPPTEPKENLGVMLARLARTSVGKVLVGQALSLGLGLAAKAVRQKLEHDSAETPKTSDLAAQTGDNDGHTQSHSAPSQPDADSPAANF